MQFRRPEAAGHRTIFAIEIAACEQIDLPGPSTRGVGKRFDGVGDAQRHMGSAVVRVHAIAVGVIGGDEHEHRLAIEIPREHRRVGALHRERHRIDALADHTFDGTGLAGLERSLGGLLGDGLKLGHVPIHRACGLRAVAVGQLRTGCGQGQNRIPGILTMQARIDSLGGHGRSGIADAAEALDQALGLRLTDGDAVADDGVRNAAIPGLTQRLRRRRFHDIKRPARTGGGYDIGRPRGACLAIVTGPGDDVARVRGVERDGRAIDPTGGAQQHQPPLVERRQIIADGEQECRPFGTIRLTAAGGTGRGDGESSVRKAEQERILQRFQRDIHTGHDHAMGDGVGGGARRVERVGGEARRGRARTAGLRGRGGDRHTGREEDAIVFVQRLPLGVIAGT